MMSTVPGWVMAFGGVFVLMLVIQLASEGLVYATGAALVWVFSLGKIRPGARRKLWSEPANPDGGPIFYREGEVWYIYRNFSGLIGLLFWLALLVALFGYGIFKG